MLPRDYSDVKLSVVEQCLVCLDVFRLDELLIDVVEFGGEEGEPNPALVVAVCIFCAES